MKQNKGLPQDQEAHIYRSNPSYSPRYYLQPDNQIQSNYSQQTNIRQLITDRLNHTQDNQQISEIQFPPLMSQKYQNSQVQIDSVQFSSNRFIQILTADIRIEQNRIINLKNMINQHSNNNSVSENNQKILNDMSQIYDQQEQINLLQQQLKGSYQILNDTKKLQSLSLHQEQQCHNIIINPLLEQIDLQNQLLLQSKRQSDDTCINDLASLEKVKEKEKQNEIDDLQNLLKISQQKYNMVDSLMQDMVQQNNNLQDMCEMKTKEVEAKISENNINNSLLLQKIRVHELEQLHFHINEDNSQKDNQITKLKNQQIGEELQFCNLYLLKSKRNTLDRLQEESRLIKDQMNIQKTQQYQNQIKDLRSQNDLLQENINTVQQEIIDIYMVYQ